MRNQILWTACVTPFNADGTQIDYTSLERCLRMQEESGNGIVLLGSTGESLSLTEAERRELVQFACHLNLKTQLLVGVPSYNLYTALEWLAFCRDLPLQGYLMTTPIYTKPGIIGQTQWFEKLLSKAGHPAMLYNIPGRAGIKLHPETVKNLRNNDHFFAIKDSGGTIESIIDYKIAAPQMAVYCGDDYMMPSMAAEGSIGLVSIASNAWPMATRRYVEHSLKGGKTQSKLWWQSSKAIVAASNPIPIKALMKDTGMIAHDTVRLPLSVADLLSRQTLLDYHEHMLLWRADHDGHLNGNENNL